MKVIDVKGNPDVAQVALIELNDGNLIECVESVQRPISRSEKWVLIVSTLKGCPVKCPICDAGGHYGGKLGADEILYQIDYLVNRHAKQPGEIPTKRLKIQFARMGDPAFNDAVLDVLEMLPKRFGGGIQPSISTVAPHGRDRFLDRLIAIKNEHYRNGWFQMQFSIHTTDEQKRRELIPIRTWPLEKMASYGSRFFLDGDRKISLNFAAVEGYPLNPKKLASLFSTEKFIIKLTPINPTYSAASSNLIGQLDPDNPENTKRLAAMFETEGFETIVSIGDLEENAIGSNCGMFVSERKPRQAKTCASM